VIEVDGHCPPKERKLYVQNAITTGYEYRVHNHSYANLRRGLLERVFYVERNKELVSCPQPEPGSFKEMGYLRRRFHRVCGNHSRISANDLVDCYQGRKRTIYENAAASLLDRAIERKDGDLKTFIKAEKFNVNLKSDPAPRVIQPRSPRYNVELGRYLKKYEHHAYKALDKIWGGPTVMKGYTTEEVAQHIWSAWNQFQTPVAIGFDMSRFDQHVSVAALEFEHSCYLACFEGDAHLANLLKMQLVNHGVGFASNGMLRYTKEGCRMSGDMNTALGNCLLACLITKHLMKIRSRLINNGDDCVLICERTDIDYVVSNLTTGWSRFGFNCIAEEPVYEMEKIRFCQMAPVFDGAGWLMVRDPLVSMSKDSHSLVHWNNEKNAKQWLKSVGMCGLRIAGGVPVVQEFYQKYVETAGNVKENKNITEKSSSGFFMMADRAKRGYSAVSEVCRFSFYQAFGITPDQQIALEGEIRSLTINTNVGPQCEAADSLWILNRKYQ